MGSLTLQSHGIDLNLYACTKCDNAIWQEIPRFRSGHDFETFGFDQIKEDDRVLCCWCTLMHTFISTPRIRCDQCIDKSSFDEFIEDNKSK